MTARHDNLGRRKSLSDEINTLPEQLTLSIAFWVGR
jgi:hypothetical protein